MKKLTKQQAILVLVSCAWNEVQRLKDRAESGPEGIEVHLTPRIKQLCAAINAVTGTNIEIVKKRKKK